MKIILTVFLVMLSIGILPSFADHYWGPIIYDENFVVKEFASGLFFPTAMTFLDDDILVLEKNSGLVRHIQSDGNLLDEHVHHYRL